MHEYWQFHEPILNSKCDFGKLEKDSFVTIFHRLRFRYLTQSYAYSEIILNKIARCGTATLYSFVKTFKFNCKFSVPFNASACISKIICH